MASKKAKILIWGVPRIDCISLSDHDEETGSTFFGKISRGQEVVDLSIQMGGCALLERLLRKIVPGEKVSVASNLSLGKLSPLKDAGSDYDNQLHKSIIKAYWKPLAPEATINWTRCRVYKPRVQSGRVSSCDGHDAYRIERWTGYDAGVFKREDVLRATIPANWQHPDILVFDDRGWDLDDRILGEADFSNFNAKTDRKSHILTNFEADESAPLKSLSYRLFNERGYTNITLVTSLQDLRAQKVNLGLPLSWERTLADVKRAVLAMFGRKAGRIGYARVVVTVDLCGAVIADFTKDPKDPSFTLIFDQSRQEGDFKRDFPGSMFGYTTVMMTALAARLSTENLKEADSLDLWIEAVRSGIGMMRCMHICGYKLRKQEGRRLLEFPFDDLRDLYWQSQPLHYVSQPRRDERNVPEWNIAMVKSKENPSREEIIWKDPNSALKIFTYVVTQQKSEENWTMLDEVIRRKQLESEGSTAVAGNSEYVKASRTRIGRRIQTFHLAEDIVRLSPLILDVPIEKIGRWSSADRSEIEGVRSISNVIRNYSSRLRSAHDVHRHDKPPREEKPISIAVFGPPGSGKSFVVKEIALDQGFTREDIIEFNLSQYSSVSDLAKAFHAIRDLGLRGRLPLVFWDEFDTAYENMKLGWLRYFLAPMQDGAFTEGGVVHPVGPAIYVFAGGTSSSYRGFVTSITADDSKKTDFISRLRAYLDVKGPNGEASTVEDDLLAIRRAFLLRSQLRLQAPNVTRGDDTAFKVEIDDQVVRAFIRTVTYRHGARSMENVLRLSKLDDRSKFVRSSLPPVPMLDMHVNAKNFMDYVSGNCHTRIRIGLKWISGSTGSMNTSAELQIKLTDFAQDCMGNGDTKKLPDEVDAITLLMPISDPDEVRAGIMLLRQLEGNQETSKACSMRTILILPYSKEKFMKIVCGDDPVKSHDTATLFSLASEKISVDRHPPFDPTLTNVTSFIKKFSDNPETPFEIILSTVKEL